jgi:hypothetical protein
MKPTQEELQKLIDSNECVLLDQVINNDVFTWQSNFLPPPSITLEFQNPKKVNNKVYHQILDMIEAIVTVAKDRVGIDYYSFPVVIRYLNGQDLFYMNIAGLEGAIENCRKDFK